jgi:hypothetical protein
VRVKELLPDERAPVQEARVGHRPRGHAGALPVRVAGHRGVLEAEGGGLRRPSAGLAE